MLTVSLQYFHNFNKESSEVWAGLEKLGCESIKFWSVYYTSLWACYVNMFFNLRSQMKEGNEDWNCVVRKLYRCSSHLNPRFRTCKAQLLSFLCASNDVLSFVNVFSFNTFLLTSILKIILFTKYIPSTHWLKMSPIGFLELKIWYNVYFKWPLLNNLKTLCRTVMLFKLLIIHHKN